MHKTILILKENITDILLYLVLLTLIVVTALASPSAQDVPSKTAICKELGQGRYQNLSTILKPDTSLKNVKLNNNGEPMYTTQQAVEIIELESECVLRTIAPFFTGVTLISIEDIENIYQKFFRTK